ncbi:subtilisin family serine protease [Saccharothrix ecbatanensis]|uniref:Subtilisin family serine protease n=1 Tax=Saccharothrix ecbatanensis TaxID=1105145 RepID=A0A7W9LZ24_9PSEU|nr:S8 family serine peptidase [Saccharothrix ecbatanensis]MBB5801371.1 subtilisin family serine protease [Saccharothrix ecbatanensis]
MSTLKRTGKRMAGLCTGVVSTIALTMSVVGVAQAAEGQILGAGARDAVEGSYIVALNSAPSTAVSAQAAVSARATDLAGQYGGQVAHVYSSAMRGFSVRMSEQQAKRLAADPAVRYVEQNGVVRTSETWGLDRVDQRDLPLDNSYAAPNDGSNVTAYVVDTGIAFDHPELEGRAVSGYDFIDNDSDASDCHGHGTHVAGTIGSKTYGIAKNVDMVAVRVLNCGGSGSWDQVIAGIEWVTKNAPQAAVGNMSLGGNRSTSIDEAVANSVAAGVAWAVAAGNDTKDACEVSPAAAPGVLTVGASDSEDRRSRWGNGGSNWGECVELFAPGSSITSITQDGKTAAWNGTSMATPHVAGALALVLAADPDISVADANALVLDTTTVNKISDPSDTPNRLLYVDDLGARDPGAPKASFATKCSSTTPDCSFDASGSTDPDGSISSYAWEFGDGTTGTGVKPSHKYSKNGTYTVKLTVTDNSGKTATTSRRAVAGPQPPRASFSVMCRQALCSFDGSGSTDPNGDIVSYAWDFGNGKTGTGVKADHTYSTTSQTVTFTAKLTVTDSFDQKSTVSKQIRCHGAPSPNFPTFCIPLMF